MIRVLLAEDQGMMRGALALLLDLEPDIEVVAQVGTGDAIVPTALADAARTSRCSTSRCPACRARHAGLDAAAELRTEAAVLQGADPDHLRPAGIPAAGDGGRSDAASSSRTDRWRTWPPRSAGCCAGERVVDPSLAAAALAAGPDPLTDRERDVLREAADGSTVADIAGRLHLSESTVRNYLSAAITKTGTRNRIEAVGIARANGWL